MLNHSSNHHLGSTRTALASALLLWGTLFFARPAQPSPSPRTADLRQIVEFVDDQGHKIHINAEEWSSGLGMRDSAFDNHRSALACRNLRLASLIRQVAERHEVDADLIHAIVNVESGYDSRAVSPRGAMGLMQLIPATAKRFGVEDRFDPKQNIEGGTSYLHYLLGLFDGDVTLSLAAYNAGENSALREGGIPPFPETREYVRKVRSLYEPDSASNLNCGATGLWSPIPGVGRPKPTLGRGKVRALAPRPIGAPWYIYVDARGVLHMEQ